MKKNYSSPNPLKHSRKKLIVYLTAGFPDIKTTYKIALECVRNGADIIELGVPFSDPIADGKTIQTSSYLALKKSFNHSHNQIKKILRLAHSIRTKTGAPIYLMTYLNPLISYGIPRLNKDALKNKISGFIIPDLNLEMVHTLKKSGFTLPNNLVFMASPNSRNNHSHLKELAKNTSGFLYAVSTLGVTGARKNLQIPVPFLKKLHRIVHKEGKKLFVGFGISTPLVAAKISQYADGIIVGSKIIDIIINSSSKTIAPIKAGKFCSELKKAITLRRN